MLSPQASSNPWGSGVYAGGSEGLWILNGEERRAGVSPPHLSPIRSLAELKAYTPLRVLTLTRLFFRLLCENRSSPEHGSSLPRRQLLGGEAGAGVTMDWKPFWHRPQMVRNRLE